MARVKKQIAKSGHVISVSRNGLNTSLRTNTFKVRAAEKICTAITARENAVAENKQHEFWSWDKKQQSMFILYGVLPVEEEQQQLTVNDAVDRFLDSRRSINKAFNTVQGYAFHLKRVKQYFGADGIDGINANRLQEFVNWLNHQQIQTGKNRGSTLSVASQKKIIARFRAAVKWNNSQGFCDFNLQKFDAIAYAVEKQKLLDRLEKWCYFSKRETELNELGIPVDTEGAFREVIYSKAELNEHLEYLRQKLWNDGTVQSRRLFAAIKFCSITGARRSELTRVRVSDIRLDDLQVTIWRRKGRKDKDMVGHRVAITQDLVPYLRGVIHQLPEGQKTVFCSDDAHMDGEAFNEQLEQSKAEYLHKQLTEALRGSKYSRAISWHLYRHTLASMLLADGIGREVVKQTIGWCSDEMADRYSHLAQDKKQQLIENVFGSSDQKSG